MGQAYHFCLFCLFIAARRHTISDEADLSECLDKYALVIQKSMRKWMTRKKIERMLKYYNYLKQIRICNEENTLKSVMYTRQKQTLINLQYPTKTKDFEALYAEINSLYKNKKKYQINKTLKSTQIENKVNLEEKLKCLREIIKHRNQVNKIAEEKKIFRELNEISKPIIMTRKNGKTIFIETLETQKAQQLMELYITLKRNDLSKNERIEFILKLKHILECFKELNLTKSIINLLNREMTMLNDVQLENDQIKLLRKRIEIEFQRILKQPEINPAIKRTLKLVNIYKCYNCRKLKTLNKFVVNLNLTKTTTCKDCKHLYRIAIEQINLNPHKDMLKDIKATEIQLFAKSSLVFFLNAEDIYYLVTIIWKEKSALSESRDISQLSLVRWYNKLDWSPSNTILLTIEEAYVHTKIQDINKVYTSTFINGIHLKHLQAKRYFKGLTQKSMECDRDIKKLNHN